MVRNETCFSGPDERLDFAAGETGLGIVESVVVCSMTISVLARCDAMKHSFDTVDIAVILPELCSAGAPLRLRQLLVSWLEYRKVLLVVSGRRAADYVDSVGRVPQGSMISMSIFSVFFDGFTRRLPAGGTPVRPTERRIAHAEASQAPHPCHTKA